MPNLTKEEYYSAFEKDDSNVYIIAEEKNSDGSIYARSFLAEKKAQQEVEASLIRDEREERILATAERANKIAIIAAILAAMATLCSTYIIIKLS
ncbi:MAG: hypothetical protein QTN59_13285 [Candidatus Electrothrix communis]|nr:MAG: hypothetical protein QTN59_13285 [Candidatus Electrothrix communis]